MRKFVILTLLTIAITLFSLVRSGSSQLLTTELRKTPQDTADLSEIIEKIEAAAEKDYFLRTVVIDAGHGGHDTGCNHHNHKEKSNTLAMALKLGEKIKTAFPDIEVIYTRMEDKFVTLDERANIANRNKADLFISIHCNSTDGNGAYYGTETYVLGLHRKADNFAVAKRENGSILLEENYETTYDGFDPSSNEGYIMMSMYQNAYLDKSIMFANLVEAQFKSQAQRKSNGVKQAGFLVLRATAMPSVLIETGYLNNKTEGAFISSEDGQEKITDAIFTAFEGYKKAVEGGNTEVNALKYYAQLLVVKAPLKDTNVGKWKAIDKLEIKKEGDVYRYCYGSFNTLEEARTALAKAKEAGFSDAFLISYQNGKRK